MTLPYQTPSVCEDLLFLDTLVAAESLNGCRVYTCVVQLRLPVEVASLTLLYYLKYRVELLTMPSTEFHLGDRSRDVLDQQLAGILYKKFHIRTLSYVYSRFSSTIATLEGASHEYRFRSTVANRISILSLQVRAKPR